MPANDDKATSRAQTNPSGSLVAPVAADLRVGTRFGNYRIDALAGRGGMGVVYRAEQLLLRRTVALKLLLPDKGAAPDFRERFVRESQTAAAINHPSIITIYDAGEIDDLLYIAMQFVDGTDLAGLLRRAGPLEPPEAAFLLGQVASALDAAHLHGMVHRDVKPENVLIENSRCFLTDFGVTKHMAGGAALTAHGQFVGTVDYIAPEQINGRELDGRADVYALACLLYHALAGSVPYPKDSEIAAIYAHLEEEPPRLSRIRSDLPPELDGVIARGMAKSPDERHPTCTELIDAVRGLTEGEGERPPVAPAASAPVMPKVMVAASDSGVRSVIRATLVDARFRVVDTDDGGSAVALARQERPDIVFVDSDLVGRPGAEVCRGLRSSSETAGTKIVMVATRQEARDKEALLAAGVNDWIAKPFSPLQLLYKVRDLLGPEVLDR